MKLLMKLRIVMYLALAAVLFVGFAMAAEVVTYKNPRGFTSTNVRDFDTGAVSITLTSGDGKVVFEYVYEYRAAFDGFNLDAADSSNLPGILAKLDIDANALGLSAALIRDTDGESGETLSYIEMNDVNGNQYHVIYIFSDGYVEYQALARADAPLSDADFDAYYAFYSSLAFDEE